MPCLVGKYCNVLFNFSVLKIHWEKRNIVFVVSCKNKRTSISVDIICNIDGRILVVYLIPIYLNSLSYIVYLRDIHSVPIILMVVKSQQSNVHQIVKKDLNKWWVLKPLFLRTIVYDSWSFYPNGAGDMLLYSSSY